MQEETLKPMTQARSMMDPYKVLSIIASLVVVVIYAFLTAKSFLDFEVRYDFLFEHLPTALRLVGHTTYEYDWPLLEREIGFPQLAHFLQGVLAVVMQRLSAAKAVNLVGFAFSLLCIFWMKKKSFPYHLFLLFLLAVPLFVYHMAIGGYVDLFYGSMILAGFVGMFRFREHPSNLLFIIIATCFTASMFSRIQAWPPTVFFTFCFLYFLYEMTVSGRLSWPKGIAFAFVLAIGVGFFPIRNMILFGNPTYPAQNPIIENDRNSFWKHSTLIEDIPPFLIGVPAPLQFAASALEINRLVTSQKFYWTVNGESVKYSILKQSNHFRTGGWFFATVIITLFALSSAAYFHRETRLPLALFAVSIAGISVIPHFLELRYTFYIPLIAIFLVCDTLGKMPADFRKTITAAFCVCVLYVLGNLLDFWNIDMRPPSAYAPKEAIEFWKDPSTDPSTTYQVVGNQNVIYWSGPTFREFKIKQKTNLPPSYKGKYEQILQDRAE